ncbi:MAG: hypothetical protein ACW964_09430 [Candidatus Hodarchaeales archaeon]|jgi:hypothetical protein
MKPNSSNIIIYGPKLPEAIKRLTNLAEEVKEELPISGGEITLGRYDFSFYWSEEPNPQPLFRLVERVDEALTGLPTKYSITTEGYRTRRLTAEMERRTVNTIFSFIRIHGPSISKALRAIERVVDTIETTNTLDSLKSSILIGEYDFAFEWDHWPSFDEIHAVLDAIDTEVEKTGALYTISTKKNVYRTGKLIDDHTSDNLMAFL